MYSTMLFVDLNCLWLVWDLDICKEEEQEECWSASNSSLTSTKLPTELPSLCISSLSTVVFFMYSTVLLVDSTSLLLMWDSDICEEEELEECWSAEPFLMMSAAMKGFHFHSAALSNYTPLSFSFVHR